jgi:hypothetical protein
MPYHSEYVVHRNTATTADPEIDTDELSLQPLYQPSPHLRRLPHARRRRSRVAVVGWAPVPGQTTPAGGAVLLRGLQEWRRSLSRARPPHGYTPKPPRAARHPQAAAGGPPPASRKTSRHQRKARFLVLTDPLGRPVRKSYPVRQAATRGNPAHPPRMHQPLHQQPHPFIASQYADVGL